MNFSIIIYIIGYVLKIEGILMIAPTLVGVFYGEKQYMSEDRKVMPYEDNTAILVPVALFLTILNHVTEDNNRRYINQVTLDKFTYAAENLSTLLDSFDSTAAAAQALDNIVRLRDLFCQWDLWPAYSAAMNLLGLRKTKTADFLQCPADMGRAFCVDGHIFSRLRLEPAKLQFGPVNHQMNIQRD